MTLPPSEPVLDPTEAYMGILAALSRLQTAVGRGDRPAALAALYRLKGPASNLEFSLTSGGDLPALTL